MTTMTLASAPFSSPSPPSWKRRRRRRRGRERSCKGTGTRREDIAMQKQSHSAVQFRPCIDIHKGRVKQIVGSTLRDSRDNDDDDDDVAHLRTNFESDSPASEFAAKYSKDGLVGGHVIMLDRSEETKLQALSALNAYPGGLQIGGGITSDNAMEYLDAGASHVIVTSFVFRDGKVDEERLADLVKTVGKERLILDLSCRKREGSDNYFVVTDRWQKFTSLVVNAHNLQYLANSCDEFLIHGVDVEGKGLGIDVSLLRLIAATPCIPLTYAGGIRSIDDLELVKREGLGRVHATVGSALDMFGGPLEYDEVLSWHNQQISLAKAA